MFCAEEEGRTRKRREIFGDERTRKRRNLFGEGDPIVHRPLVCWFPNPLADGSQMGTLSNRRRTAEPCEYRKTCLFECLKTEGTALQINLIR